MTAVKNQDLSIVLEKQCFWCCLYIVVSFITDVLYVVVEPRIALPAAAADKKGGEGHMSTNEKIAGQAEDMGTDS